MRVKLYNIFRFLFAFSITVLVALPTIPVHQVAASPIFEDGFESGGLGKWSPIGGSPSVTSGDAHHGTYKAVLNASGEWAQARFTFTPIDHGFMRAYVMFKSFPATGVQSAILGVYDWASGRYMSEARVINVAGTVKWALRYYHNGAHYLAVSEMQKPVLDTWYCVEVEGKSDTTTGAESRIYIDGNELTDVSQTGKNNPYAITCAYIWVNAPVTHWYDCVVVDTAYIGPENLPGVIVNVTPETLNLKWKGNWISCYIELPDGYDVEDIDLSSILINNSIPVDLEAPTHIGDADEDGIPDLMVKFDRDKVSQILLNCMDSSENEHKKSPPFIETTLEITGELFDGPIFEGYDTIRAILKLTFMP